MSFKRCEVTVLSSEFPVFMLSKVKSVTVEISKLYEEKRNQFRSVDTDTLLSLYCDIERSYKAVLQALDTATSTQSFYFSADASNFAKTMSEIRNVLFTRGLREIPTK